MDFGELFAGTRVLVILRGLGPERSLDLATRAWDAGVRLVEVPLQSPADLETLTVLAAAGAGRGRPVGAGTVLDAGQVEIAATVGARFTVSPGVDPEVVRASRAAGLPTLPGVATATDIQHCLQLGVEWLKAFPAAQLGPDWVRAMRGPFPGVRFVATGGIDSGNARTFLSAGAAAVSFGSALADPEQLAAIEELVAGD